MDAFQATCARITLAFDGFLADFRGDGILAYFGYPRRTRTMPNETVRAALDIVSLLRAQDARARAARSTLASPPAWWWSAASVARGGTGALWRDPTSRLACRDRRSRIWWYRRWHAKTSRQL
jgi:hypothetical protein